MTQPLVTVGISMVREDFSEIELAIRSIYAQTVEDWELVVFLDGSPSEYLDRFQRIDDRRVTIHRNERSQGLAANLNRLAHVANGKYIAIIAADDLWTPDRLEVQLRRLEQDDAPDVLAAQMIVISDNLTIEGAQKRAMIPESPRGWVVGTPLSHATAMAKTSWFRQHPYDEALIRAQDRAFWIEAHQGSRIEILDDYVYYYRVPRPAKYRKYAWSSKYARQVIWRYGRKICSTREVIGIYVTSIAKQAVVALSTLVGGSSRLYYRRIDQLSRTEILHHGEILSNIQNTFVPGWD